MNFGITKFRQLLFLASCGMCAEFLLALADTVIAGHLIGEGALAGINLLQPIFNFIQFTAALIGTGTAIRFSLETGRLNTRRANEIFSQGFWSVLIFGSVLLLAFIFGREAFLGFFGASEETVSYARSYWVWYAPCVLFLPMTLYLTSVVYADGDMLSCTFSYVSLIGGNIVASYFLCKKMGLGGCALGTVCGNFAAIVSLSTHFLRNSNTLRLIRHFKFSDLLLICQSSFADASVSLCWSLLFLMLAKLVVMLFGSEMLPVLSVVLACVNLTLLFNGISAAVQPVVGIYIGEQNTVNVRKIMDTACLFSFAEGLIAAIFFAVIPQAAVALVGIDDASLYPIACTAVRLVSVGFIAAPFVFLFNSYYLFIERYMLACMLTFVADIVVYLILCPPLAIFFGTTGLWLALGIAPITAVAGYSVFILIRFGKESFPLLLHRNRESKQFSFGFKLSDANIATAAAKLSSGIEKHYPQYSELASNSVKTIFSEVQKENGTQSIIGEAGYDLNDGFKIILRDDGKICDVSQKSTVPTCTVQHFVTMGYNRYVITNACLDSTRSHK